MKGSPNDLMVGKPDVVAGPDQQTRMICEKYDRWLLFAVRSRYPVKSAG
jgi:hypothetical protein